MDAELMVMKGRSRRGLRAWMARANSSLPLPLSPRSSTVDWVWATWRTFSASCRSSRLLPMMTVRPVCDCSTSRSTRFSRAMWVAASALSIISSR